MNTHELFVTAPGLDHVVRNWLLDVVSTRGKWKGYLLNNAPSQSKDPVRWATWQAIMGFLAPTRCSMFSLMLMGDKEQKVYNKVDEALKARVPGTNHAVFMFLQAAEPPFRWNMFAHNNNVDLLKRYYADRVHPEV